MAVGIGLRAARVRPLTAEIAELGAEFAEVFFARFARCSALSAVKAFFLPAAFLRSALATASASQAALSLPRVAGRLLVHSAESVSPPICAMVRLVRTDVS